MDAYQSRRLNILLTLESGNTREEVRQMLEEARIPAASVQSPPSPLDPRDSFGDRAEFLREAGFGHP